MSGNLKLIKRRTKSAKNIGQITKAMEMVAASKMRKAQKKALDGKLYSQKVYQIVNHLMKDADKRLHPLLKIPKADGKPLLILIATNRGLCGSLNLNLFRTLQKYLNENNKTQIDFITLGTKGLNFIIKTGFDCLADFSNEALSTNAVYPIMQLITRRFIKNKNTSISLVYNDFINALKQEAKIKKILPLTDFKLENDGVKEKISKRLPLLIEPSAKKIIKIILPFYLESQIREAIFEAEASEHSARMMAMKNATENAQELVNGLTLEYNKARQQAVTSEITDIVTAKISMEDK